MDTTLLLVLCILALLIAAAVLALVRLRAGHPGLMRRRSGLVERVHTLGQEFSSLARRQPANPGEPYASRLELAGRDIRAGWLRAREMEAGLRAGWQDPALRPAWQLALIAPLFMELAPRLRDWLRLVGLERQAGQVENVLTGARRQLDEISGLGTQEQSALRRLRAEVQTLDEQLVAHPLAPALSAQREKLSQIDQDLAGAAARLGEEQTSPEPSQPPRTIL